MSANYTENRFNLVGSVNQSFSLAKSGALLLLLLLGAAGATVPASAQTPYHLNQGSTFEEGCFPPCECPEMIDTPVQGTCLLTPTSFDGVFHNYDVTEVNWIVRLKDTTMLITGSGTYKVGGEVALQQELSLNLQMGEGGSVEHFDSGLVPVSLPASLPFPDIKITISINGMVCFDKVFNVSISPTPQEALK